MLNTTGFKNFIELEKKKKELKKALQEVEDQKKGLQQDLIDNLLDQEMTKISISGKTVYVNTITRAKIKDRDKAVEALKEAGFGDLVKESFNTNSVSALLRELQEDGDLPEGFEDSIEPVDITDLRVINA